MELLQDTNFWLCGSFLIFCFVCYKFGKDSFLALIDGRINEIKDELKTAENLRIEAQELLAQYQRKHRDAMKEAEGIVSNAEKHAQEIRKQAETNLAENIARRETQLKDRIHHMEQAAKSELQRYAADLSIHATTHIIAEQLDKKVDTRLLDHSIQQLKSRAA